MTETESEKMLLEKWIDLLDAGLPQTYDLLKKKKMQCLKCSNRKHNKMRYGQNCYLLFMQRVRKFMSVVTLVWGLNFLCSMHSRILT